MMMCVCVCVCDVLSTVCNVCSVSVYALLWFLCMACVLYDYIYIYMLFVWLCMFVCE